MSGIVVSDLCLKINYKSLRRIQKCSNILNEFGKWLGFVHYACALCL